MSKISLVVPIYNEAENITPFYERASKVLDGLTPQWEIICVNDGSQDGSMALLVSLHQKDPRIKVVDLSRNFGKEIALSAGIDYVSGDILITMDADLQHPPEVITEMIKKWHEGCEIVFAFRRSRKAEGWVKRHTSKVFYWLLGWLTDIPSHNRIGDFCLLDRRVVEALKQFQEHNRFMKGLFAWVGFKQDFVMYDMHVRNSGTTKWSYWRLWNFAIEGITSFSSVPLRVWTYVGCCIALISLIYATVLVIQTIALGIDVPGYASLMVGILFIGGIQLISLGIIGEYIGRIYREVKSRPLYLVKRLYGLNTARSKETVTSPTE
ncbi:MAG: glycosyltransferase family 2 protein [Nitrospirae bacterium]|nr:glycosyltransferase family 2 protein [Nitrospirota bacterium]